MARATGTGMASATGPYASGLRAFNVRRSQGAVDVTGADTSGEASYLAAGVVRTTVDVTAWFDDGEAPPATGSDTLDLDSGATGLAYGGTLIVTDVGVAVPLEQGIEITYSGTTSGAVTIS